MFSEVPLKTQTKSNTPCTHWWNCQLYMSTYIDAYMRLIKYFKQLLRRSSTCTWILLGDECLPKTVSHLKTIESEFFELEESFTGYLSNSPAVTPTATSEPHPAWYWMFWASNISLSNLIQCFTTLSVKIFVLISNILLSSFIWQVILDWSFFQEGSLNLLQTQQCRFWHSSSRLSHGWLSQNIRPSFEGR